MIILIKMNKNTLQPVETIKIRENLYDLWKQNVHNAEMNLHEIWVCMNWVNVSNACTEMSHK